MTFAIASFVITWIMYVKRLNKKAAAGETLSWTFYLICLEVSLTLLPVAGMWFYHTQLTMVNLTTNEHLNVRKYKYLFKGHHGKKTYHNPWFKGWFGNMQDRLIHPGECCYMIPKDHESLLNSNKSGDGAGTSGTPGDIV